MLFNNKDVYSICLNINMNVNYYWDANQALTNENNIISNFLYHIEPFVHFLPL